MPNGATIRQDSRAGFVTVDDESRELVDALTRAGVRDSRADPLTRALYTSDASLYRVVPKAVVRPRHGDEIEAALAVCRDLRVPLTARGAGTSLAGNAVGPGVVMDLRSLDRLLELDPGAATARVEPGVVLSELQRQAAPHGLRFGPDPSTSDRCTIGGMLGNDSCGSHSLLYGRTSTNLLGLDAVTGQGRSLDDPALATALREIADAHLAAIRTEFGRFGRQVSGYALEHLLPERGLDVARAVVGSEGTLVVAREATVRLVPVPKFRALAVLGYPDMVTAAGAVPGILASASGVSACEGLDSRMTDLVRSRRGLSSVPELPAGSGWLLVETTGDIIGEAEAAARAVLGVADASDGSVISDVHLLAALWRIREDGAALVSRTADGAAAYPGWEDAAVPVEHLGGYVRDFDALLTEHGLSGVPYGHFGDGCVHIRIDFPLDRPDGRSRFRALLVDAAALVARYGGSLSGEHGDGRARSELLPVMYSAEAVGLFKAVKHLFDPDNILNPGVLVDPDPADAAIRAARHPLRIRSGSVLAFEGDGHDLLKAVHRCSGVGRCIAPAASKQGSSQVMCPSFAATGAEIDSTRGRARMLQEMLDGEVIDGGWRAPEVHAALELCLSCKACSSDCPTGVDMAAYKSEVLHQAYRGRIRPRSHYAFGRLPQWLQMSGRSPLLAYRAMSIPAAKRAFRAVAGVDARRSLPVPAPTTFRRVLAGRQARHSEPSVLPEVALFVDTFTDNFDPGIAVAAVRVLEGAGYRVRASPAAACCALPLVGSGQLDAARRRLRRTVDALYPLVADGVKLVGLEPSCTSSLRSDLPALVDDERARAVAAATVTVAELLTATPGWAPPDLSGRRVVAQPHCHQHAVSGWSTDADLLRRAGATVHAVSGCCGMAGSFGLERGHYEVSVAVAENGLLPALRAASRGTWVLADGFSCRTQIRDLTDSKGTHLVELLDQGSRWMHGG